MSKDNKDKGSDEESGKKKGGMMGKLIIGLVLLGVGGGGVVGLQMTGLLPGGQEEEKETGPQLVLKGEEDPYYVPAEGEKEGAVEIAGEGGSKYRTAYFIFSEAFTSNLKESAGLVQVSLAASTQHDGRVLMWLKKHELAVRSRILVELADTPEEDLLEPDGKVRLQKRLTSAINDELTKAEGFGGIHDVYFRTLLVQ